MLGAEYPADSVPDLFYLVGVPLLDALLSGFYGLIFARACEKFRNGRP